MVPASACQQRLPTGKPTKPLSTPPQLGCMTVAPLPPQGAHRADRRRMSLEAFGPNRMMSGASAFGTLRQHPRQLQ
jgi:hypothetical protein